MGREMTASSGKRCPREQRSLLGSSSLGFFFTPLCPPKGPHERLQECKLHAGKYVNLHPFVLHFTSCVQKSERIMGKNDAAVFGHKYIEQVRQYYSYYPRDTHTHFTVIPCMAGISDISLSPVNKTLWVTHTFLQC